jgi:hypothetical protein
MTEQTSEPRTAAVCKHLLIYRDTHGTGWACSHCKRRFYPAWHEGAHTYARSSDVKPDQIDVLRRLVEVVETWGEGDDADEIALLDEARHALAAAYAEGEPE